MAYTIHHIYIYSKRVVWAEKIVQRYVIYKPKFYFGIVGVVFFIFVIPACPIYKISLLFFTPFIYKICIKCESMYSRSVLYKTCKARKGGLGKKIQYDVKFCDFKLK